MFDLLFPNSVFTKKVWRCNFKLKRTLFIAILVVVISLGVLPTLSAKEQTLRIMADGWIIEKYDMNTLISNYEADHTGVKVELITKTEERTPDKFILNWTIAKKTDADLILSGWGSQLTPLVAKDLLEPWDSIFTGDYSRDKFIKAFLDEGTFKGKVYGLPFMGEVFALVVNTEMFKEAGLVDSKGNLLTPKTWDEVFEFAEKLAVDNNNDGKPDVIGLDLELFSNGATKTLLTVLQSATGHTYQVNSNRIDLSNPVVIDFFDQVQKGVKKGYVGVGSVIDGNAPRNNMKARKAAMILSTGSRATECAEVLGDSVTVMMPPSAAQNGSISFAILGWMPRIATKEAKLLAYEFVKEQLLVKEAQQWSALRFGKLPVLESNYQGLNNPIYTNQLALLKNSGTMPKYIDSNQFEKIIFDRLSALVLGDKAAERVFNDLQKETNRLNLNFLQ